MSTILPKCQGDKKVLTLATVGALAVPVLCTLAVECASASNGDARSRNADERTSPLLITEGSGTGECHSRPGLELSEIYRNYQYTF
jgi:hypothetical protein